jgi:hypothetical protein
VYSTDNRDEFQIVDIEFILGYLSDSIKNSPRKQVKEKVKEVGYGAQNT